MLLTEEELCRWGDAIGREMQAPVFLCLRGELGAGKSVLARAVARGAGVEANLPSPTYNLLFRYDGDRGLHVAHLDLYRLGDPDEIWEIGWEELGARDEIVLVEWPERAGPHLPGSRWDIALLPVAGEPLLRRVEVTRVGDPPELPGFPLAVDTPGSPS